MVDHKKEVVARRERRKEEVTQVHEDVKRGKMGAEGGGVRRRAPAILRVLMKREPLASMLESSREKRLFQTSFTRTSFRSLKVSQMARKQFVILDWCFVHEIHG